MRFSNISTIRVEKVGTQLDGLDIMSYQGYEVGKTLQNLSYAFNEFDFTTGIEKLGPFIPYLPAGAPKATKLVVVDPVVSARLRADANSRFVGEEISIDLITDLTR